MAIQENERLDRMEQHLRLLKESDVKNSKSLSNIENALIGSDMNGHKGLVSDVDEIKKSYEKHKTDLSDLKNDFDNAKFWGKLIASSLVLGLVGMFLRIIGK